MFNRNRIKGIVHLLYLTIKQCTHLHIYHVIVPWCFPRTKLVNQFFNYSVIYYALMCTSESDCKLWHNCMDKCQYKKETWLVKLTWHVDIQCFLSTITIHKSISGILNILNLQKIFFILRPFHCFRQEYHVVMMLWLHYSFAGLTVTKSLLWTYKICAQPPPQKAFLCAPSWNTCSLIIFFTKIKLLCC